MIELSNISKNFNSVRVIEKLNIRIGKNTPVVLFGPSGSGKTTILRLIAGLEIPDAGSIYINGCIASKPGWVLHPKLRSIGLVFQSPALWPHMTVEKNIMFGLSGMDKQKARKLTYNILEETGLSGLGKRFPHQLSGGQAKRAALARALVVNKDYYLMDEPLSNQDEQLKEELLPLILRRVEEAGAGLVYITHDMEEAGRISQKIIRIMDGKIVNCE